MYSLQGVPSFWQVINLPFEFVGNGLMSVVKFLTQPLGSTMKSYTELFEFPFGTATLRVTTNGTVREAHDILNLPLDKVYGDIGEEHNVATCLLGGLRVHLNPGELLLREVEIHVGDDWESEQSYGMSTEALSAWSLEECLVVGLCNNEMLTGHDAGLELIDIEGVSYIFATYEAIRSSSFRCGHGGRPKNKCSRSNVDFWV